MSTHRWIRFDVVGMTLVELEQKARAELTRFTGDPPLPFNLEIVGDSIDTSVSEPSSVIAGYRAEVKAVVERVS